jgi:hypothetical protein
VHNPTMRALGAGVWGRKVARLPDYGVLLVATDLQGNRGDYERLKCIYDAEENAGNQPILAFCGDLVHGPSPDLHLPGAWPAHLGTPYFDESADLLRDFELWTRHARAFSVLGNHEHAHIGGPVVPKFYPDEAAILDAALGHDAPRMHAFLRSFPLLAVAPGGLLLVHAAPAAAEHRIADYEHLSYDAGYRRVSLNRMYHRDTLSSLLWARSATKQQARDLLASVGQSNGVVIHGHDVVDEGYEAGSSHHLCVSTSFGLYNPLKTYVRLDLSRRYRTVDDIRPGIELLPLYPQTAQAQYVA